MTTPTVATASSGALNPRYVAKVSGELMQVQTDLEAEWYEATRDRYLAETKFTENTDLQDLDRVLLLELMIFRWGMQLTAGVDYAGDMINEKQMALDIKGFNDMVNKVKEQMGLSVKARNSAANDGNFASWFADVKSRARMFGIHREAQLGKALALMSELATIVGAYDRSDHEERKRIGFESESDIVGWVRSTMLPEYQAIDDYFVHHEQRYWRQDQ